MKLGNKKGFTLIEVIVVVMLIGLVISMAFSMLFFGYNVFGLTSSEFEIQSNIRLAMEEINTTVRSSKAMFAVPDATFRDEQWNYIAVSPDGTTVLNYVWDPTIGENGDHVETIMVGPYDNVLFNISFFKEDSMSKDNFVKMRLEANINGSTKRFDILTGYEALNSLQVIDYGTDSNPARALAYRGDVFHYENMKIYVNIALVLDSSGSMSYNLTGGSPTTSKPSRISILKTQAKNLIDQLAQNTNSDVTIMTSLIEYNYTANDPDPFLNVKTSRSTIRSNIDALCGTNNNCQGATNIGDGLRRAYHNLEARRIEIENSANLALEEYVVKNYVILLTDGDYTVYSRQVTPTDSYRTFTVCSEYNNRNNCKKNKSTTETIQVSSKSFYLGNQNVTGNGVDYWRYIKDVNDGDYFGIQRDVFYKDADSWSEDPFFGSGQYVFGRGGDLDSIARNYITEVSNLGLNNNENFTNYVIRFTSGASLTAINNILSDLNVDASRYFSAETEAELGLSFTNIQTSITNDTWHYLGPRLSE